MNTHFSIQDKSEYNFATVLLPLPCGPQNRVTFLKSIVNPLRKVIDVLEGISEGDGDLTQRLPIIGKDEVSMLSRHFNKTFEKIGVTLSAVINESEKMQVSANSLGHNVSETASAVNEISSNIASIRGQITTQNEGVDQTVETAAQISANIDALNDASIKLRKNKIVSI